MSEQQPPQHMEKLPSYKPNNTDECYICGKKATDACYRCHKRICSEHSQEHQLFYSEKHPTFCENCEKITDDMLSSE